jgi:hypothetical protein
MQTNLVAVEDAALDARALCAARILVDDVAAPVELVLLVAPHRARLDARPSMALSQIPSLHVVRGLGQMELAVWRGLVGEEVGLRP